MPIRPTAAARARALDLFLFLIVLPIVVSGWLCRRILKRAIDGLCAWS